MSPQLGVGTLQGSGRAKRDVLSILSLAEVLEDGAQSIIRGSAATGLLARSTK